MHYVNILASFFNDLNGDAYLLYEHQQQDYENSQHNKTDNTYRRTQSIIIHVIHIHVHVVDIPYSRKILSGIKFRSA